MRKLARADADRAVPSPQLNRYLEAATVAHPPPLVRGRRIKLRYMTQIKKQAAEPSPCSRRRPTTCRTPMRAS